MGAKQSKRSVDISGKEAESAGEVAASIAGGEGRVEQLADADALKPQLNGDAHIHEANTDEKQKEVDSGTPENEKDATTEKEEKQEHGETEAAPLTNGESEQKVDNGGETTPTSEDGKKPKKEKVKKKWSLRSISFSRKDKPKQDKKTKDEETKTNGEPEKVPEETIETASEVPVLTETAGEVNVPSETKEDKTPETPVTEPITNGSSTPESPKVEIPVVEEPAVSIPSSETERPEVKPETKPEQLPVNGLSLEESSKGICENEKKEDSKEETTADTTEVVPEISVKKEVCVEQMPLIESTPPPLPANPPPSSVVSFAATTMAPELTDASLVNTADNAVLPPLSDPNANVELNKFSLEPKDLTIIQTLSNEISHPAKEVTEETSIKISEIAIEYGNKESVHAELKVENNNPALVEKVKIDCQSIVKPTIETVILSENVAPALLTPPSEVFKKLPEMENELPSEISGPATSAVEQPFIDKELDNEIVSKEINVSSLSAEVVESKAIKIISQKISENEVTKPIVSEEMEKEIVLENTELEMPPPPSELIEDLSNGEGVREQNSRNFEPELPDPPMEVAEEEPSFENGRKSLYANLKLRVRKVPKTLTDVDNIPPPPPVCEELVSDIGSAPEKDDKESIVETNEIAANPVINTEEEDSPNVELKNNNENIEQNIKNKSKDSLGNLIEIIECNGNIDEEKTLEEAAETVARSNEKEITNVIDFEVRTTANSEHESSGEPRVEAESAAPQEVVSVSDKLAELIPEVPEVPEIITETAVDTTNDVAVTN